MTPERAASDLTPHDLDECDIAANKFLAFLRKERGDEPLHAVSVSMFVEALNSYVEKRKLTVKEAKHLLALNLATNYAAEEASE